MEKITILIADDHALVRETWSCILNNDPRFKVIAGAGNGKDAVKFAKLLGPNIIFMDIDLPGINGIEATGLIREISPDSKILAVSLHTEPAYARQMMNQGAMGYLTKNSSSAEMFRAILDVHSGRKYICKEIKNNLSEEMISPAPGSTGMNQLTAREAEIVIFIKKGDSSKEIAGVLHIAVKTVETHRYNILKKFNLKNSSALVNFVNTHPKELPPGWGI
jgi:DNA-binding NarL/FixJ family response regulator